MGTVESKSEYALLDVKKTDFGCAQYRKDSNKTRGKVSRSKSSAGRDESVQMSSSIFTSWMTQPEQKDAGHQLAHEELVNLQDSLR